MNAAGTGPIVVTQSAAQARPRSDEFRNVELTPELCRNLLDPEVWAGILETYAHTMRIAVGLANLSGRLIGSCHNPQSVWLLVREAAPDTAGCPFCLQPDGQCTAVGEAMQTGRTAVSRDQAGLAHVAVPLLLGNHKLGALLAGQVFDRYPEPLPLQRLAREFGLSPQNLWHQASQQAPVSNATLRLYGDLLMSLGQAFLGQRYAAILEGKLSEANHRYRLLINSVKDYAFFTVDQGGRVTGWNKGAETLLGYAATDIVGRDFSCLFSQEEIDSGVPAQELQEARQGIHVEREGWRIRQDGSRFFAISQLTMLEHPEGNEYVKIVHDITERRNAAEQLLKAQKLEDMAILERRVLDRTHELKDSNKDLQRANQDLQQFAHSASHDLQEPLRAVTVYSQLFKKLYEGKLDDQADEFLGYMADGAKRMQMLVRDLLAYTQATVDNTPAPQVDANVVLAETIANLEVTIVESNAVVTSGQLPTIQMHGTHLGQLFQNLIGNAIKYQSPESVPFIEISAEQIGDEWIFSISDNGIGIEPRHAKQVFGIFKRLHTAEKYTGTGIGLAICQKIVESYRGRIWVESNFQKGSKFCFALPV